MGEIVTPELKANVTVVLEMGDHSYDMADITERAKADYRANYRTELKDISIYVKPEDGKAYYTANDGKVTGNVGL